MSKRLLQADVGAVDLQVDDLDPSDIVDGEPGMSSAELARLNGSDIGIWQLTEGQVTDTEVDEVFIVLSGRGQVTFEDGTVLDLQSGTAVRLFAGERTTWTITETLRKIYVVSADTDHKEMGPA